MAKRRKKSSLALRYQRACQAALRNRCVAWIEEGDTCIVNLNSSKVYRELPKDLFEAITDVPYQWTIQLIIAGKSTKQYTKGLVVQTTARYYASDLTKVVEQKFKELNRNFNPMHYHRRGFVAVPRIEDFTEEQTEEVLDRIGLWENFNED